ncbi:MAG TPA: hypothetical protein VNN17_05930, partial [Terriglobia bacterium]|nr:hypothetical protein [Terriglobia bacterium]
MALACGMWASAQLGAVLAPQQDAPPDLAAEAAESAARKYRHLQDASNNALPSLQQFSEQEVNSYLHFMLAPDYPAGLAKAEVRFLPGRVHGTAVVDFDKAKAARRAPGGMS